MMADCYYIFPPTLFAFLPSSAYILSSSPSVLDVVITFMSVLGVLSRLLFFLYSFLGALYNSINTICVLSPDGTGGGGRGREDEHLPDVDGTFRNNIKCCCKIL